MDSITYTSLREKFDFQIVFYIILYHYYHLTKILFRSILFLLSILKGQRQKILYCSDLKKQYALT